MLSTIDLYECLRPRDALRVLVIDALRAVAIAPRRTLQNSHRCTSYARWRFSSQFVQEQSIMHSVQAGGLYKNFP